MNAFVRQIAVLSVLWAMCELLLPDGKQQQMVRMTASMLVMAALITTVSGWLGSEPPAQQAVSYRMQRAAEDTYQRTALAAMANQVEGYCAHMLERAGYQGGAAVYLTMDGAVDHIELTIRSDDAALLEKDELAASLARQLGVDESCIRIAAEGV